jgi:hypothetical protein
MNDVRDDFFFWRVEFDTVDPEESHGSQESYSLVTVAIRMCS